MEHSYHAHWPEASPPAIDSWRRMMDLTGIDELRSVTGWDLLIRAMFDAPAARLRPERHIGAISLLVRTLAHLRESEFEVIVLRFGVTVDDREIAARSRREISLRLGLSYSRIAQLERSGLDSLREQFDDSSARLRRLIDLEP